MVLVDTGVITSRSTVWVEAIKINLAKIRLQPSIKYSNSTHHSKLCCAYKISANLLYLCKILLSLLFNNNEILYLHT